MKRRFIAESPTDLRRSVSAWPLRGERVASIMFRPPPLPSEAGEEVIAALKSKALPWVEDNDTNRFVTVRSTFKAMKAVAGGLPEGVEITHRPITSRRQNVRERPAGIHFVSARWPAEALETKRFPIILCTLNGPADLRIGDYVLHSKEGRFIFVPPGVPHPDSTRVHVEGENEFRRSCDILWFSPMGDVLRCWICRSANGRHLSFPPLYLSNKKLTGYCQALFDELGPVDPLHRKMCQGLLIVMLASIQSDIQEGRFFRWLPQAMDLAPEDADDPIKRAQSYIQKHLSEHLTLEHVARNAYMSRSQFAKKFREETSQTFGDYLTQCRIEEAKIWLTTTPVQVAGLSGHVGLKPRRFTRVFQEHTGLTPAAYRRKHSLQSGLPVDS